MDVVFVMLVDSTPPIGSGVYPVSGALGNLIDRVRLGYVVDMFNLLFMNYPVFNVADILVVCGAVLGCIYYFWFYERYDKAVKHHDA